MSHETVRDEVLQTLCRNFLGPIGGPEESFSATERETPVTRYMTGILFPSESTIPPAEDDGGLGAESNESVEEDEARLSMCNAPNPSSYGISFACRSDTRSLLVKVECGIYSLEKDKDGNPVLWTRRPFNASEQVPVANCRKVERHTLAEGLELRVTFRPPDQDGQLPITATLINTHSIKNVPWNEHSTRCFFQCAMTVSSSTDAHPFVERRTRDTRHLDTELRHALLLYRHARLYAVGHGCAADWAPRLADGTAPQSLFITFIPTHDVYPLVPPADLNVPTLPLVRLAEDDVTATTTRFTNLVRAYEHWIEGQVATVEATPEEFRKIADDQLTACRVSAARIRKGIEALSDPLVFRAFQLAQKTMLEVFARSEWQKKRDFDPKRPPTYGEEHKWFPFQAAFFLQALESVANPESSDRDICDLLWFPTGGGKTEAYLALTAFVLFLRRLRALKSKSGVGGGTAVLMRYTLRLLTADQFVRACLMICAAESVRRNQTDLAKAATISIGLWVGEATSPNWLEDAAAALDALHHGRKLNADQSSPMKLKRCPWCGTILSAADYKMASKTAPVVIACPNKKSKCEFRSGIPAAVVDEQIYAERPSLVIGTIDKFARLPWEPRAGTLFSTDGTHPRPELVIQDELHLISGPLGTIAGLYEAAIDHLCTDKGIRPKLVASTATIRNAESQVRHLFNRRFAQFPQPLLDARDSFFARQSTDRPPRRFAGLFTPGKTPLTAFIRMAGCLSHAPFVSSASDDERDPYWTLIAYFNSLRELGGAIVRVHDDVAEYMKTCATLDGSAPAFRTLDAVEELTSRAGEEKLDEVRDRLWARKSSGESYDMVLCSNMISVGLDVPRLGLMSVIGQPKTTAEYIQATSRIGRAHPGLVVTLYNWTRSRDRSHYERFVPYHSRLYAEVEATSVTPYSSRARDRALHAVLAALARHLVPSLINDSAAGAFRAADATVGGIIQAIKDRITAIETDAADSTAANAHLDQIAATWESLAIGAGPRLRYGGDPDHALLVQFEDYVDHNPGFATMNNMRNVDAPAGLYLEL